MYITESASEQDEANPVFWLAPWAGKVGPYYCACVSPIKKLSCRERVKQLLHFENKINVITKFKYLQDFTKILWWAVKWGAVKHWKHRLPTNVLIRLWLFDCNFIWQPITAFRQGYSEMHLYCSIHFRMNTGTSCISFSSSVSHPSCACCSSLYDLLFCWSWKSEESGSCPQMETKRFC